MKLSIVIPAYNEEKTIKTLLNRVVEQAGVADSYEIIVVDDSSSDQTIARVEEYDKDHTGIIRLIKQEKNQGKGAALRRGFSEATGDVILVQDADLEYDPHDYVRLLKPIKDGVADVVYGTRFKGEYQHVLYFWHYVGNALITLISNMLTNLHFSDVYVCYKVFKKEVMQEILPRLSSDGFAIEAELTARIAHTGPKAADGKIGRWRAYEVPISYFGRTYDEGKKIRLWDGVRALAAIFYFNTIGR